MTVPPTGAETEPLRILLVEDDALIGMFMAELLVYLGYEVYPVETTESGAVSAAARHRPDLIIIDMRLADGSGRSAMARIEQNKPTPHIFMSGDLLEAAAPGTVLLRKPFRDVDLERAIGQALGAGLPNYVV